MNYKPKRPAEPPRFAGKYSTTAKINRTTATAWRPTPSHNPRITDLPASLNAADTPGTYAAKHANNKYTGTACLGIAAMHKSNLVPIFNADAAVDAATMRRN
jgi:hypothetical protein